MAAPLPALSPASSAAEIIAYLRAIGSEEKRQGMQRFGVNIERALGIPHDLQRQVARTVRRNHERAFELWATGLVEARFVAAATVDPRRFTIDDARAWAAAFDSWDIVDGVSDLFVETEHWHGLILEFAADEREFVRRAAFAMVAWAAVHRKKEPDQTFIGFFSLIEEHAGDTRNFVKKAVNWALRQIGKRSLALHAPALAMAEKLAASPDRTARWIGKDAVRELTNPKTLERLKARESHASKRASGPQKQAATTT